MTDTAEALRLLIAPGRWLFKRLSASYSASNAILITDCETAVFNVEIATTAPIYPDLLPEQARDAGRVNYYLNSCEKAGWAGECKLRFTVKNTSEENIVITALGIDKERISVRPRASVKIPNQGGPDSYSFRCDLDDDRMVQRFEIVDGERIEYGEKNFFDESPINICSGESKYINLVLVASEYSYQVSIYLRYEVSDNLYIAQVPLDKELYIYPLSQIPDEQRLFWPLEGNFPYLVRMSQLSQYNNGVSLDDLWKE